MVVPSGIRAFWRCIAAAGTKQPPLTPLPVGFSACRYYWDTFWALRGLLACGLVQLAQVWGVGWLIGRVASVP